jgi:hypothetical protein
MAKYEDTFTPSERFGDLEFTWDVDFPRLLSNSPEAEQPSEFLKLRSPLTGTGARTNIPEGFSEEDAYEAWNLGMGEHPTMGRHVSGGVTDYHHNPTGYPLEYFHTDSTIEESYARHGEKTLRVEKNKIRAAAKKAGVDFNLLWSLWRDQERKSDVSYLMAGALGKKEILEEVVIGDDGKEFEIVSYEEGSPTSTKHITKHETFHGFSDRVGDELAIRGVKIPWIDTVLRNKPGVGFGGKSPIIESMDVKEITTRLFMVKHSDYSETFYTGFSEGKPTFGKKPEFKQTGSPVDHKPSQYDKKRLQMKGIYKELLNISDEDVDDMFFGRPNWIRMVKEFVYPFWVIDDMETAMEGIEPESSEYYDKLEELSSSRLTELRRDLSSMKGLNLQDKYRQVFKKEIKEYYPVYFGNSDG